ncbi:Induced myeloid leukemia cell differentiation protein Mcl-1-like [Oryzias melastigma]|uniref:Induced myeloid leukemia cell differentiation protein Mcl-1-like n=1 Tax=Oryzias melastigma TaxID=30732 RepID=A0A834FLU3_ORYME|nr:Induced myeloid leukemia cell differentiation protein Mcl-1-like [Oryzias melastigma]
MLPLQKHMVNSYITPSCGYTALFGGAGERSARVSLTSATASRGANPDPSEQMKRPQDLDMLGNKSPYAARRFHVDDDDGGSLPNSPELECDNSVLVPNDPPINQDTTEFLTNFFRNYVGLSQSRHRESKYISTAKRVVNDVMDKHRFAFNGMINRLSLEDNLDDMSFISRVAENMFADGTTNWGRIASLLAFGAAVCLHLKEKGRGHSVDLVSQEICTYLLREQRDWLINNNSWDGFVEFFHVPDPESTVRNTLVAVLGLAGVGALLAQVCR